MSREWLVGLCLAALVGAALPLALSRPPRADLHLSIDGPRPRVVLQAPGEVPLLALPIELGARTERGSEGIGALRLQTLRVVYGARWERELTVPILSGPFEREGTPWRCALAVRIGAGVFDTTKAGAGIERALAAQVRKAFPAQIAGYAVPPVKDVKLTVVPKDGDFAVHLDLRLADGTFIKVDLRLAVSERDGLLGLSVIGEPRPQWGGPLKDKLVDDLTFGLPLVDWVFGVSEKVGQGGNVEIAAAARKAVLQLSALLPTLQQIAPFPARAKGEIAIRVKDPRVTERGLSLLLCPTVTLAAPKVDASILGPPRVDSPTPSVGTVGGDRATVELVANADGLNQLLYVAWQTGTLQELARSHDLLSALPPAVKDLTVKLTGFSLHLPPVVSASGGAWTLGLGDVGIGTLGVAEVLGHATLGLAFGHDDASLRLTATLASSHVDCATRSGPTWTVSPCISDVLPAVRKQLAARTWVLSQRLRDQRLTGGGLSLTVSDTAVRTEDAQVRVTLDVTVGP